LLSMYQLFDRESIGFLWPNAKGGKGGILVRSGGVLLTRLPGVAEVPASKGSTFKRRDATVRLRASRRCGDNSNTGRESTW
jgi:hypothetical protein